MTIRAPIFGGSCLAMGTVILNNYAQYREPNDILCMDFEVSEGFIDFLVDILGTDMLTRVLAFRNIMSQILDYVKLVIQSKDVLLIVNNEKKIIPLHAQVTKVNDSIYIEFTRITKSITVNI